MTPIEFDQRLTDLLITPELKPHVSADPLYNGAQTWGGAEVKKVGFAVSSNLATFTLAAEQGCDALIVHHGLWLPAKQLDRITYDRLAFLIKYDMMLWSAHFVLDAHPTLGNNAQLLQTIGISEHKAWNSVGVPWGRAGKFENPKQLSEMMTTLQPHLSSRTLLYDFGPTVITTVVSVSGAGAPNDFNELRNTGVDLFITGEVNERHQELAREAGINLLAGGHYHTEKFGVQALMPVVASWGLETVWLEVENQV
jgi:dinuclear metal center YbgI/SA1388 family protein